jgi:phytoene dehydrogenase-like protein
MSCLTAAVLRAAKCLCKIILSNNSAQTREKRRENITVTSGLQVVPWAREHLDWQMVGTPLTHQHFRRRYMGAYGPKDVHNPFKAGKNPAEFVAAAGDGSTSRSGRAQLQQQQQQQLDGVFSSPKPTLAMKGLYCCGDCTFPWIGTPAVAASGMWVANTLAPVWKHWAAANVVDK